MQLHGLFFTKQDREHLNSFPKEISQQDMIAYFTLSRKDRRYLRTLRGFHNRLGFAIQLCILNYMGFCPDDIVTLPLSVVEYLAKQLGVHDFADHLKRYGQREQTRTAHRRQAQTRLGYKRPSKKYLESFAKWLLETALEHDKPKYLFQLACEKLKNDKIIRPGITVLEQMVTTARWQAHTETYNRLEPLLTVELKAYLDGLLVKDKSLNRSSLSWLRLGATANNSAAILETVEKLSFLRKGGVHLLDLYPG
jgi:hypothetical protein